MTNSLITRLSSDEKELEIPPSTYYVSSGYLDLDDAMVALLGKLPPEQAATIISDLDRAFFRINNLDNRYRVIYLCLRLATLLIDDLAPSQSIDELDGIYNAAILQGQTMTALWAIAEEILRKDGISGKIKPLQSDRYLCLRQTPIVPEGGKIIICDELISHHRKLHDAFVTVKKHLGSNESDICALVAHDIDPSPDTDKKALEFHADVAKILGSNIRPHSGTSCYSKPVQILRADYFKLLRFCLTNVQSSYDPMETLAGPLHWGDAVPWDATDPDTYWNTEVTKFSSLLCGGKLDALSERLGFKWSNLIDDVCIGWHVVMEDIDKITVRFVPQVILRPLKICSLQKWFTQVTGFSPEWTDDRAKAAADFAGMVISAVVLDLWKIVMDNFNISTEIDERMVELFLGTELAEYAVHPDVTKLKLLETGDSLFGGEEEQPFPRLDPDGKHTLNRPFVCPVSAKSANVIYEIVQKYKSYSRDAPYCNPIKLDEISRQLEDDRPELHEQSLRADFALFMSLAGPTWARSEWVVDGEYVYPAVWSAEVAPLLSDFEGSGPHIANIESYADLPRWSEQ